MVIRSGTLPGVSWKDVCEMAVRHGFATNAVDGRLIRQCNTASCANGHFGWQPLGGSELLKIGQ
jgi:hypothetical protein